MNNTTYLSGKKVADYVYKDLKNKIRKLDKSNIIPGLAVVLVGENPASKSYVISKTKIFRRLNLFSKILKN